MNFTTVKKIGITLILTWVSSFTFAQVSISAFLSSAAQDPELEVFTSQINFLNTGQYRLAPLRGIELRTQNNQLGSGEQQYGLRVNPANPWELKYTNKVFRSRQVVMSLQKELEFKEALGRRYQLVNELLYLNDMRLIREAIKQNTEYQILVLEKQKASSFFEAEDYVELKLGQMEEITELEIFDFEIAQKKEEMKNLFPAANLTGSEWVYASIINLPQLEKLVDSLMSTSLYTTRLAYRKEKITLADYEYDLQKSNINPGFIQTEYMPFRFNESKNPMGISMGINIPIFNPNKADMAEKKLDILEAKIQLSLEKRQAEDQVNTLLRELKSYLERYKKLDEKINAYNLTETFATINALSQSNPIITLKVNVQVLKLKKIQLQLKNQIYQTYIKLLLASDLINQKPLINYLNNKLEPL